MARSCCSPSCQRVCKLRFSSYLQPRLGLKLRNGLPISKFKETQPFGDIGVLVTIGISIWAIVDLGVLRGEAGSNAFGPNPLSKNPEPPPAC
jgi:hypothetical protein